MEETVSLNQLFDILRKRLKIIIIFVFLGFAISGVITFFFITPKFSSQAQLVVTLPQSENTNVNDVNSNLQMITTYKDFITSDLVLNQVEDRLKTDYNVKLNTSEIKNSVTVQQNQNSQMFSIMATSNRANQAMYIANTVATIFQENAKDVLNVDRITIISKAVVSTKPVSPNNNLNLAVGIILGMLVGIMFAFIFELLDRTVKESNFITDELGFTILGTVPEVSDKEVAKYIKEAKKVLNKARNSTVTESNDSDTENKVSRRRSRV